MPLIAGIKNGPACIGSVLRLKTVVPTHVLTYTLVTMDASVYMGVFLSCYFEHPC